MYIETKIKWKEFVFAEQKSTSNGNLFEEHNLI